MQEIRRFRPSTISRRFSVVAGSYRTCVLDGIPEHSPAEHVRRTAVPPNHLRFHRYDQLEPSPDMGNLLRGIDRDPSAIFWG